ncbi:MAG: hypothetical protein QOI57_165 [Rubrobacteraceae bacterium]|nr:hypothetical protein [Rubrobacteraceae bacterium]
MMRFGVSSRQTRLDRETFSFTSCETEVKRESGTSSLMWRQRRWRSVTGSGFELWNECPKSVRIQTRMPGRSRIRHTRRKGSA